MRLLLVHQSIAEPLLARVGSGSVEASGEKLRSCAAHRPRKPRASTTKAQIQAIFEGITEELKARKVETRLVVPVRTDIQRFRIARVNDDVVDEESGLAEVIEQLPAFTAVGRRVNLPVERSEIESIRIRRIDY